MSAKKFVYCFSFLIGLVIFPALSFAQKENTVWYFGDKMGLDFNTSPPTLLRNGGMSSDAGCASVADKNGSLLFYTNGKTVWNKSHDTMSNGDNIGGNANSTQVLIVKQPGTSHLYYIITPNSSHGTNQGVRYSIIDITKDSGLGEVIRKNDTLSPIVSSEKITAVKDAKGCGYWIITHPLSSDCFYTFHLGYNGLDTTPVISCTGLYYSSNAWWGYLKASPDGTKLASCARRTDLYNFDKATGKVSNGIVLDSIYTATYGCSFSPDSKLLYLTREISSIVQYDVTLSTPSQIKGSMEIIYLFGSTLLGALQLGPDNKIYVVHWTDTILGVIRYPNVKGLGCYFDTAAMYYINGFGLPNMIDNLVPFVPEFALGEDALICIGDSITLEPIDSIGEKFLWSTGDTVPKITVHQAGNYWLKATRYCYGDTTNLLDTIVIKTVNDSSALFIGSDTTLCSDTFTVKAINTDHVSYLWSTGDTASFIKVSQSGNYSLLTTSLCGVKLDSISVALIKDTIPPIFLGKDTLVCGGGLTLNIPATPNAKYIWNTGDTSTSITASNTATYWVTSSTLCNSESDTIVISFYHDTAKIFIGPDTTVCDTNYTLNAPVLPSASYLWSTGKETPSIKVSDIYYTYWVRVTTPCSVKYDTTKVELIKPSAFVPKLVDDTLLCKIPLILSAGYLANARYKWSNGDTLASIPIFTPGTFTVEITREVCNEVFRDTVNVGGFNPVPLQLPGDVVICRANFREFLLSPNFIYNKYSWSTGSTEPAITVKSEGIYTLTVTDTCGTKFTDAINIEICDCGVFFPTAFSPNGDNLNDDFKIFRSCNTKKYHIKIYSIWGHLVFETNDPDFGWDGTFFGNPAPVGVYGLVVTGEDGLNYKGSISLVR